MKIYILYSRIDIEDGEVIENFRAFKNHRKARNMLYNAFIEWSKKDGFFLDSDDDHEISQDDDEIYASNSVSTYYSYIVTKELE